MGRKNIKKEEEYNAKRAAKEARKKKLEKEIEEIQFVEADDELKEKREAVIKAIQDGEITKELLTRFAGSPIPLFLEPLSNNRMGYRVTYLRSQEVIMPTDTELSRLRIYDGVAAKTQLVEMLGWNIRQAVLSQQEKGNYEQETKKYAMAQITLQVKFDDQISVDKSGRIVFSRNKNIYKTNLKLSDIETDDLFYMKAEGVDVFGGINWKPQFETSKDDVIIELESRIRNAAKNARAETGPNAAMNEILKLRQIFSKWVLLFGSQVPMDEKPNYFIHPYDTGEYAEDLFGIVCVKEGKVSYQWKNHDAGECIESENFWEHANMVEEYIKNFPTKINYRSGQGLMKGFTDVSIKVAGRKSEEITYTMELIPHTFPGWSDSLKEAFQKFKDVYENRRYDEWQQLADEYPLAFADAASIRIAKSMLKGSDIDTMQNKCKFLTTKEFNRHIDAMEEAGVINVWKGRGKRHGYWGDVWDMCTNPPDNTEYVDVDSFAVYTEAKAEPDPMIRKVKMLELSGGFMLAYIDELQKEFQHAPKPVKEMIQISLKNEKDKKKKEALSKLL